ncbi:hypothetical protein L218DRAFT_1014682 [Marasmius fiardii PR-910]|nr:hypothetical protein L218DRAFT_1014682 [Marasmius fiardii PR-910]
MAPLTLKLFLVVSTVLNLSQAAQRLFSSNNGEQANTEEWDLDLPPAVNTTGHLIFETASSLLQQWPNTRYRNGHNLVLGYVPPGTLLYHGRQDSILPAVPDWIATDPEHALMFCRSMDGTGCWLLTLVTERPLNVLYFDGSSAAKMAFGSMDSQDLISWGEVLPDRAFSERPRIESLCAWGKKFDLDGFVRMEMDFEVMLCDFTSGVEVESFLNLESHDRPMGGRYPYRPGRGHPPPPPQFESHSLNQQGDGRIPIIRTDFEVLRAGARHNTYPGESRIKLDLSRLISFYDTDLVPSLIEKRFNATSNGPIDRLDHRLQGISKPGVERVLQKLESTVTSSIEGSGVDWFALFRVIKDRYAESLELARDILNDTHTDSEEEGGYDAVNARRVMSQLTGMMHPYILYTLNTTSHVTGSANSSTSWAAPAYRVCSVSYTRHIRSSPTINSSLTRSEWLLLDATEQVTREICRTISNMWAKGVAVGLSDDNAEGDGGRPPRYDQRPSLDSQDVRKGELENLLRQWKTEIERLMNWLDWSLWLKCRPACGFGEICYLPTWPFFNSRPPPGRHLQPPEQSRLASNWPFKRSRGFGFGPDSPPGPPKPLMEQTPDVRDPQPMCRRVIALFD